MKRFVAALLASALAFLTPVLADAAAYRPLVNVAGVTKQIPNANVVQTPAPTTANASINLPHGTAPSAPVNGDMWSTTAGFFIRVNGATIGPLGVATPPGGSSGQIQYNNAGAFGGFTAAGDCTFSVPNFTCTKTGGVSFAASATTDTTSASNIGSGTLSASRIAANSLALGKLAQSGANTMLGNWSSATADVAANAMTSCPDTGGNHLNYVSGTGITCGTSGSGGSPGGSSGQIQYNNAGSFGGFTLGGDCTFSVPNVTCTKTGGVSFGSFATGTDAANLTGTLNYSRLSLTNTHILVGNGSGNPADVAMSGDATIANTGAISVTKTGGVSFAASATTDTTNASNISAGTLGASRGGAGAVSGILKGNGAGVVSAAASGTDYAPATSGAAVLYGNGSGGFSNVTIGSNLSFAGGTLTATGAGGGTGLFGQVLSATPTISSTGYSTWVSQGATATVTDVSTGMHIEDLTSAGAGTHLRLRTKAVPATPYSAIALIALDLNWDTASSAAGFGWYDGTNKIQAYLWQVGGANNTPLAVYSFSTPTAFNAQHFISNNTFYAAMGARVWMRLKDDGTNISFAYSVDGVSWNTQYTVAKASGYLGSTGYSNLAFVIGPQSTRAGLTVLSYTETSP